jgi:hypothetical protein
MDQKLEWMISVPIFRNRVILKQLGLAIGIPFGAVIIFLIVSTKEIKYLMYSLGLIALLFLMTYIYIMVIYKGAYKMEFILDDKGVLASTQADEFRKNTRMNALTMLLGTLTGKPAAAGAGMLAQSRQRVFIKWSDVTDVKYKPNSNTILLKSGWTESIAIFCTDKLYDEVSRKVEKHITNNSVSGHAPKR